MTAGDACRSTNFMYPFAHTYSSYVATRQANHHVDDTKESFYIPPVGYHWPHFQAASQFVAPVPHCPQPAFSPHSYASQWPIYPLSTPLTAYHTSQLPSSHLRPGAVYQQHPASSPLQPPKSLPAYHTLPTRVPELSVYNQAHSQADTSKQKWTQHQFGPPQKPIQSRYALWVGGIPSDTNVLELRDHFFIPETAGDILSVVLMPRSHSGFINFRTARSCKAAAYHFNGLTMNNAILRCRCRRQIPNVGSPISTYETTLSPSSPMNDATSASATDSNFSCQFSDEETSTSSLYGEAIKNATNSPSPDEPESHPFEHTGPSNTQSCGQQGGNSLEDHRESCRYFLIKSLTLEELVASVNSGRWATQSQNESVLNEAYQSWDAVYLIFSVNRSGEFFGYARMTSPITSHVPDEPSTTQSTTADEPQRTFAASNTFKTPAKGLIPEGRVVDDLYRGKIFWEVCDGDSSDQAQNTEPGSQKAISSFKADWISVRKLPFWQTKHLHNAWNDNKPVKVGRDGTELETEVGRKLCNLFLSPHNRKTQDRAST